VGGMYRAHDGRRRDELKSIRDVPALVSEFDT
jgi:hypothetical protein